MQNNQNDGRAPTGQALAVPVEPASSLAASRFDPSRGFLIKRWCVAVDGYGTGRYEAPSRGKAMAAAWNCDAFGHVRFGQFMKMARCWRDYALPARWGDPIIVDGRPAFFVENNRQYVRFAYPGSLIVFNAHPYDVLPVEYRPDTYRDRDSDGSGEADKTGTGLTEGDSAGMKGIAQPQGDPQ